MRLTKTLFSTSLLAASMLAASVQAASIPALQTYVLGAKRNTTTATFEGGATLNNGASYLKAVPANVPVDIAGKITMDARDVGLDGDLFLAIGVGPNLYQLKPDGSFKPWNFNGVDGTGLEPFTSKTLGATETVSLEDLEGKLGVSLDGKKVYAYLGYMSDTSKLNYSTAIIFDVENLPSATCPVGVGSLPPIAGGTKRMCVLNGTYTKDVHLTNNFEYIVEGPVLMGGDNADKMTLTIDAGVKTYGESGADFIRISRGSKIYVNGTPEAPVIMTGAAEDSADEFTTGLWGGLVVNGNALINGCTAGTALCEAEAEGNAGKYGGNNSAESSGAITYLVVKYAGYEISPGNELNSLTLNAVGSGTLIDYVQLHNGSDDGFETFGGAVNAKHLVLTGNDDDSLDWQKGWTGKVQHVVVITKTIGDRGIEADNNSSARDSLPRSKPTVANVTMMGKSTNGNGIKLRDGTAGKMYNIVVKGYGTSCVDIDHGPTFLNGGSSATSLTGELTIANSLFDCTTPFTDALADNWSTQAWFTNQTGNLVGASSMTNYINSTTVNQRPAADLSADSFFDHVDYIGAIKNSANDWTAGWTFREPFEKLLP